MPRLIRATVAMSVALMCAGAAFAGDRASKEEAKALLDKAVAHAKDVGTGKAFADFSRRDGGFVDRDLYVYCADMQGNLLAHGDNPNLIGKNLMELKDPDGFQPVKEAIRILSGADAGTLNLKWPNPVTKKIEPKSVFLSKVKNDWCGVGYYTS